MGWKKDEDILPPPAFAIQALPANWCWEQNVQGDENVDPAARFKRDKFQVDYLAGDAEVFPESCRYGAPSDPDVQSFVTELRLAFDERPIWTRRALINRVRNHPKYDILFLKTTLKYVCFQIRSGPFRDCLVRYGVDPRREEKYHIYQSIYFRALDEQDYTGNDSLEDEQGNGNPNSHIFDGKNLFLNGKTWQLCDVRDPVLVNLINAPLRDSFDSYNGYYHNGTWAKIRSIMRIKLHGLLYNIPITDEHLETAMKLPDIVENAKEGKIIHIPLPDFKLTEEEIAERLAGGEEVKRIRSRVNPGGKRKNRSERAGRLKENFRKARPIHPRRPRKIAKEDKLPNNEAAPQIPEIPPVKNAAAENGDSGTRESTNAIDPQPLNETGASITAKDVGKTPGIDEEMDEADDSDMDGTNLEDYEDDLGLEDDWGSEDDGSEEFGEGEDDEEIGDNGDGDGTDVAKFIQQYTAEDEWA
jgi:general transcription factor 3C polypeptide 5 (transcription factor C subunit 1)